MILIWISDKCVFKKSAAIYEGHLKISWAGGKYAAVMQREAVNVIPSFSGGSNVVAA
jgi:hypothetical protein